MSAISFNRHCFLLGLSQSNGWTFPRRQTHIHFAFWTLAMSKGPRKRGPFDTNHEAADR